MHLLLWLLNPEKGAMKNLDNEMVKFAVCFCTPKV